MLQLDVRLNLTSRDHWRTLLGDFSRNASPSGGSAGGGDDFVAYFSPFPRPLTIVMGVFLVVLGISTFLLNAMVVMTFMCRWQKRKTPVECCIINLSVTGIAPALMSYPLYATSCFNGGWFLSYQACIFDGTIVFFFGMASIGTLLVIAVLRLLGTLKPRCKLPSTRLLLFGAYSYALLWTVCPLFGWGEYAMEPSQLSCTLLWHKMSLSYFSALVTSGYCFPLLIIAYCYVKIWLYLRQSQKNCAFTSVCSSKVSLTKVTFYTCMAFFIAWTPYTFFSMLAFHRHRNLEKPEVYILPGLFAKMSWLYNPIIYFYMVKRFRKSAIATLCCMETATLESRSRQNLTARRTTTKVSSGETMKAAEATALMAECIRNEHFDQAPATRNSRPIKTRRTFRISTASTIGDSSSGVQL